MYSDYNVALYSSVFIDRFVKINFWFASAGGNATIKAFPLENLLPKEGTRKFYRYRGSVDVPNCEEAVEWTVFETPLEVSAEQLAKFRKIMAFTPGSGQTFPMVNNYRPLQSLGDRVVYRSAANFCLPSFLGFLCCFFAFFWRFVWATNFSVISVANRISWIIRSFRRNDNADKYFWNFLVT